MEDDGSPLNNFGKGLKKLFGKNRQKPLLLLQKKRAGLPH